MEAPSGDGTRPTTDRVRESIMSSVFSIMGGFDGMRVLDAFAGSGAMGLESMSRGAMFATLNDSGREATRILAKNRDVLGYSDAGVAITSIDAQRSGLPSVGAPFDVVFLDPPYRTSQRDVVRLVADARERGILSDGFLAVYEHDEPIDESLLRESSLALRQEKRIGKTHVTYIIAD